MRTLTLADLNSIGSTHYNQLVNQTWYPSRKDPLPIKEMAVPYARRAADMLRRQGVVTYFEDRVIAKQAKSRSRQLLGLELIANQVKCPGMGPISRYFAFRMAPKSEDATHYVDTSHNNVRVLTTDGETAVALDSPNEVIALIDALAKAAEQLGVD